MMFQKIAIKPRGKRKAPPVTLMPTTWDRGADGPANQHRLRSEPATDFDHTTGKESQNPNGINRRRRQSWIDIYRKQGRLTAAQAAAADKLLMASEGMKERDPIAALGETRVPGGSDPEAARVDSRRYFRELWAKVPGSSQPVIERVVLDGLPIWDGNTVQRARHMKRLADGLDAIA